VAADILCRGHLAASFIKRQQEKKARKGALWEVLFWTLDDRGKGSKSGESK
jgi:hypothetical protein